MILSEKLSLEDTPSPSSWRRSVEDDSRIADHHGLLGGISQHLQMSKPFWRRHGWALVAHFTIFMTYSLTFALFYVMTHQWSSRSLVYSPANDAVEWNVGPWPAGDGLEESFVGIPRPALEQAWDELLRNMNVRISEQDVKHFDRLENAVSLPDGSGYLGTLNVYHEIHCVRWLHKYLYQEIYWPNLDDDRRHKNLVHSEHCLSALRKFALCHGDVGLVTYSWHAGSRQPSANATEHACVNWDVLAEWSKQRAVNMYEPGLLVHPTLGPAYPQGEPVHDGDHEEIHTLPPQHD